MIALGIIALVSVLGLGGSTMVNKAGNKQAKVARESSAPPKDARVQESRLERDFKPIENPYRSDTAAGLKAAEVTETGLSWQALTDRARRLFDGDQPREASSLTTRNHQIAEANAHRQLRNTQFFTRRPVRLDDHDVPSPGNGTAVASQSWAARTWAQMKDLWNNGAIRFPLRNRWTLTSHYGSRIHPISGVRKNHHGTDLAAATGSPIYPIMPCEVTAVDDNNIAGLHVECRHPNGYKTRSLHMSQAYVKKGDIVNTEQALGAVGESGSATGPHLHIEIYKNGKILNPESLLFDKSVIMS
jgi:murein DD-endopeptidase MepM/ murein hydrolase activator NlpD